MQTDSNNEITNKQKDQASIAVTVVNILQDFGIQIICLVDLYPIDSELHILHNASTGKSSVICNVSITVLVYYFLEYKFPYLKMSLMGKLIYWLISTHFFLLKKIPTNLLRETYILKLFYKEFYFIYDLQSQRAEIYNRLSISQKIETRLDQLGREKTYPSLTQHQDC